MATVEISTWSEFQAIIGDGTDDYLFTSDLLTTDPDYPATFDMLAEDGIFQGDIDGDGHVIDGLVLSSYSAGSADYGYAVFESFEANMTNLHFTNLNVSANGTKRIATVFGFIWDGNYTDIIAEGSVSRGSSSTSGDAYCGGLFGSCNAGVFTRCGFIGDVSSTYTSSSQKNGGFSGQMYSSSNPDPITVNECFYVGNMSFAGGESGGFTSELGGSAKTCSTFNTYVEGSMVVTGGASSGFVKDEISNNDLDNCYSALDCTGVTYGFTGSTSSSVVSNCYYDTTRSGLSDTNGGSAPKTTTEMYQQATYSGWDFSTVWVINEGNDYPRLQWETELELLESMHDGTNGYKVEYNITSSSYRITHGSEFKEFAYVRSGTIRRVSNYNATTKELEFFVNGVSQGTHTFTNALVMPSTGTFYIEGQRTVDEWSYKEGPTASGDVATDYTYFT